MPSESNIPSHKKKVLSIDGGGIRGIIPAVVLAHIEAETGKSICELFDLIAGTSTGGILALALTLRGEDGAPRYSAKELVSLYVDHGREIFPPARFPGQKLLRNLTQPKYSARGLRRVLQDYFQKARMGDAMKDVMVTAYNIDRSTSWFFKSHRVKDYPERNYLVWQVARATSAAPTYLPPAKVYPPEGILPRYTESRNEPLLFHATIDGGVFANNPAMCAYVEALTEYGAKKDEVLLVSLGTGECSLPVQYKRARRWGLLQWAPPMLGVVFDGVSDTVHYQLRKLLEGSGNYYRFQREFKRASIGLDDVSPDSLRLLIDAGNEILSDDRAELDALCKRLAE